MLPLCMVGKTSHRYEEIVHGAIQPVVLRPEYWSVGQTNITIDSDNEFAGTN